MKHLTIEYIDKNRTVEKAQIILKTGGNLLLKGETGTGKTTLVHYLTEKLNIPLYEETLSQDTNRWNLIAQDIITKGTSKIRKGIVVNWLEEPESILFLDGFNYAPSNSISLMESLSDFRGTLRVHELSKVYKRTTKHYLIVAMNPFSKSGYTSTFRTNIATLRRFEPLTLDYLDEITETKLLNKINKDWDICRKLVSFAKKIRDNYKLGKLSMPITTGNLKKYVQMHNLGLEDKDILDIISGHFLEEERPTIRRLWGIELD